MYPCFYSNPWESVMVAVFGADGDRYGVLKDNNVINFLIRKGLLLVLQYNLRKIPYS